MAKREIFMANGTYQMCDVLEDQQQDRIFQERTMKVRAPDGREFMAVPMLGTWGEEREWMKQARESNDWLGTKA